MFDKILAVNEKSEQKSGIVQDTWHRKTISTIGRWFGRCGGGGRRPSQIAITTPHIVKIGKQHSHYHCKLNCKTLFFLHQKFSIEMQVTVIWVLMLKSDQWQLKTSFRNKIFWGRHRHDRIDKRNDWKSETWCGLKQQRPYLANHEWETWNTLLHRPR